MKDRGIFFLHSSETSRILSNVCYLPPPIAKPRQQSIMPPPYPPVFAALWEWLVAPVIVLFIATLPWSLFFVGAYLTAGLLDGLLTQHFARRHESGDDDG
jgi:hypothetical protein